MLKKNNSTQPKQVKLTAKEANDLRERVLKLNEISDNEKELLAGLITFNLWLQQQLSKATFTIKKLKRLFGFKTEKKSPPPMM